MIRISEELRTLRIAEGKPGSACPKGYLVSNTEFTKVPICTASRAYQRRKLQSLDGGEFNEEMLKGLTEDVTDKACICHDLAGSATVAQGIEPDAKTAVCCGPNTVYFSRVARLREMVDHIYGRARLPLSADRPHMFLKELSLHLDRLKREMERRRIGIARAADKGPAEIRDNLLNGIRLYRETAASLVRDRKDEFLARLEKMRGDLDELTS